MKKIDNLETDDLVTAEVRNARVIPTPLSPDQKAGIAYDKLLAQEKRQEQELAQKANPPEKQS